MTRDEIGSYPAVPEASADDDAVTAPELDSEVGEAAEETERRGPSPAGIVIGIAAAVLLAAVVGLWVYVKVAGPVPTPSVVSLTPTTAEELLRAAHLKSGKATYQVTSQFPAGRIIDQAPKPYVLIPPGSPVNIKVAVAPKPAPVPDVSGTESAYARSVLRYALFEPVVLYAYSSSVPSDKVIEQLPRAGDTALTGSPDVIVVSLGVGVPGSVVPAMIGQTFAKASVVASDARLFAQPRAVLDSGTPDGTVVDQAPAPGMTVPMGTNVWVSVVDSRGQH